MPGNSFFLLDLLDVQFTIKLYEQCCWSRLGPTEATGGLYNLNLLSSVKDAGQECDPILQLLTCRPDCRPEFKCE